MLSARHRAAHAGPQHCIHDFVDTELVLPRTSCTRLTNTTLVIHQQLTMMFKFLDTTFTRLKYVASILPNSLVHVSKVSNIPIVHTNCQPLDIDAEH
jgi:hypothetical protein